MAMQTRSTELWSAAARASTRAAALLLLVTLAACSGDSGAGTELNIAASGAPSTSQYNGPPPATDDVQSFKLNLWDNISSSNRCGSCHSTDGGQAPMFARNDDINLAYTAANGVVTLTNPENSLMVTKVAGGHNCWLTSDDACAEILGTWITNWAGGLASAGGREIEIEAPPLRDPGQSRNFPGDASAFSATVYPLLAANCATCHSSASSVQQSPFFAEGPASSPEAIAAAYEAAKARINLDDPSQSRFVLRLGEEFHNCWTNSCANDSDAMEAAIESFALGIPLTSVDPNLIISKALSLFEGTIASGGNRHEANTVALYEFKTGSGVTAFDTSGVDPAMDLTLSGSVEWFGGWGLNFSGGKAQATTASSSKLHTLLGATGEYSIEAWVVPANVVQDDTRIVSYSANTMTRNFNLGQTLYNYDFFNRSNNSDANGVPRLSTPDAAEVLQATLQHVVVTFDPVTGRKIYVNGMLVADQDSSPGGNLSDWDAGYAFVLGNEVFGDGSWSGVIRLVAVHNRQLTDEQILQNFDAGVGEKFFVPFSVAHLTGIPDSYVVFEVSQFDSHSYLFRTPFFLVLDDTVQPDGIDIEGIRVGINGLEAGVGQSFAKIDEAIASGSYDPETGQPLSSLGAVLPLMKGPDSDEFFLTFDSIGGTSFARPAPIVPPAAVPQDLAPASEIGVRTFDEINATMAKMTTVSQLEPAVRSTFEKLRQSLPTTETAAGFLASHQVSIAQLSIQYCNALINDTALRTDMFPAFPFTTQVANAFPGPGPAEDALLDPLLDRVLGDVNIPGTGSVPILSQPDRAAFKAELTELIHGIPADITRPGLANGGGDLVRTQTIAKAVCAAALGSGAMLIQ